MPYFATPWCWICGFQEDSGYKLVYEDCQVYSILEENVDITMAI